MNENNYEIGKRDDEEEVHLMLISEDRDKVKSYWIFCNGNYVKTPLKKNFNLITCNKCKKEAIRIGLIK